MPVHLTAVKCPSCGTALEGKVADRVYLCDCGVLHTRDDEGIRELTYTIAKPSNSQAPPSDVAIHYTRSEGGFFNKLFGKDWKGGRVSIYVPAVDWEPGTYKQWAGALTSNPPRFQPAKDFGAYEREPVVIDEVEAKQLADFLILTFEAEKPGVLQEISYEVKVFEMSVLYVPFDRGGGSFQPMF